MLHFSSYHFSAILCRIFTFVLVAAVISGKLNIFMVIRSLKTALMGYKHVRVAKMFGSD